MGRTLFSFGITHSESTPRKRRSRKRCSDYDTADARLAPDALAMSIHRMPTLRATRLGLAAAALALTPLIGAFGPGGPARAAAPADRLPDLSMTKPADLRVETTSTGARRLRFTTSIVNIGAGPFETRASRRSTSDSTMGVSQRIHNTVGGTRVHETTEVARYAGDGHDHWHVQRVAHYELFSPTGAGPVLRRDSKVGFCFFDTNPYRLSLPGAPTSRQYLQSGCGSRSSLFVKNGISVGWSDRYPWNFAWQLIDVTGLAAGEYMLRVSADPKAQFEELIEKNNCNWTRIRIPRTAATVQVLDSGWGCVVPGSVLIPTGHVVIPPRPGG
jgi:hypothetical protein